MTAPETDIPEMLKQVVTDTLERVETCEDKMVGGYWFLSTEHAAEWAKHILKFCGSEHLKAKAASVLDGNLPGALDFDISGYPVVQAGGDVTIFALHTNE